jgi:phosphate transport system protein
MQTHLEESMQQDIDCIRNYVAEMSHKAEVALQDCVKSFVENDHKLAYAVILRDQYIDEKEKEIDRLCLEFIIRQQPVAQSLRFIYSTIRINLEIERVGDYAESIARHLIKVEESPPLDIKEKIVEQADVSIRMFHDAIQAFVDQDMKLAVKTIEMKETADAMRTLLNNNLVSLFREQKMEFEVLDPLTTVIRRFERVADQARNICLEVLYLCTGENAKHPGAATFRILFVDDHNSCRSQIAEAIASSFKQSRFVFSSAGLEPLPIDHATIEFMKSKGFDLSRMAPKAVHQVPNLDHYQVIVALSKNIYKVFPQHPGKVIFLDWLVDDPSHAQASSEKLEEVYEKTFLFLQDQIKDMIEALIGTEKDKERR